LGFSIADLSKRYANDQQIRKMMENGRSKHLFIYEQNVLWAVQLLHDYKSKVEVNSFRKYIGGKN